ncbi:MAG: hypothetical protein EAZ55_11890 [Cytophagales bacterium]|nr:MAG: hypothetical protein EAZ55_11890 [Cytophagales bacterium]
MKKWIIYSIVLLMAFACQAPCIESPAPTFRVSFFDKKDKNAKSFVFKSIKGVGRDSVLYNAQSGSLGFVDLPVSPLSDSVSFVFDRDSVINTFTIRYGRTFSVVCDVQSAFSDLVLRQSNFDSIVVVKNSLDTKLQTNIQVYYSR